jgi:predicted enzyme related to lactoylglutathione lyase
LSLEFSTIRWPALAQRHLDFLFVHCEHPEVQREDNRWERHDWWGVVLDTDDVETLTRFYADLRGWQIHRLDETDGSLDAGEGVAYVNIQYNSDYVRPVWPGRKGEQQMMLHLDFEVVDLEAEVDRAVALGAELPAYQPQTNVRVLLDPSGHPFCIYKA